MLGDVGDGSAADIRRRLNDVRFTPKSGRWLSVSGCLLCQKADIHLVGAVKEPGAVGVGIAVATLAKGTSVILVLNQYNCIGCSPGKCPDTRTVATASDEDSRGSVHDSCLCIAV
jgi:hypothetical protein